MTEQELINNIIGSSPVIAILSFAVWRLYLEWQKERDKNEKLQEEMKFLLKDRLERDKEDGRINQDLTKAINDLVIDSVVKKFGDNHHD